MSVSKFPVGTLFTIPCGRDYSGNAPPDTDTDADLARWKELRNQKHVILKSIKSPTRKVFESLISPELKQRLDHKWGWLHEEAWRPKNFGHNMYYVEEYNTATNEMSAGVVNMLTTDWKVLVS